MQQHGILNDSKAETRAAQFATATFIDTIEPLKEMRQMFLRHANTIVGNRE